MSKKLEYFFTIMFRGSDFLMKIILLSFIAAVPAIGPLIISVVVSYGIAQDKFEWNDDACQALVFFLTILILALQVFIYSKFQLFG